MAAFKMMYYYITYLNNNVTCGHVLPDLLCCEDLICKGEELTVKVLRAGSLTFLIVVCE